MKNPNHTPTTLNSLPMNHLMKDSPMAVAVLDTNLCFISYSTIWLQEFGNGYKNLIGRSYYDINPRTPKAIKIAHTRCLNGYPNSSKGKKIIHSDGSIQWLKWKMNAWRTEEGQTGGIIIVQEDISSEKFKENLLLMAKKVAKIGGWRIDMNTNKVYWTDVTKEIHEVAPDYVPNIEEGINFYKKGKHRELITELVTKAMIDGTSWDVELIIVTARGKELWVRAKGEAELVNGKCVRVFGTFQDIDAKKRAELQYQEVSDRLAIATNAAKIGIWDYDIVDNTLIWDDNMYAIYGVEEGAFGGVYEAWENTVHPDDKESCQTELEEAIEGIREFNKEFRIIWPNKQIRYIKSESTVRRDSQGRPIRMIGANWDITEEKEYAKNLNDLLKVTGEQNDSLLNFAHIVSHNLRSHSSNLSMLSGFLKQENDEKEREHLLTMLSDAATSLNETVVHLNEVVHVKTNVLDDSKSVNIFETLAGVQRNLALLLQEKKVSLQVNVDKKLTIMGVPAYVDSVFLNLITNGIKYASPKRTPEIIVSTEETKEEVHVLFLDNGLGIDLKKYGGKLFGMYKTFHNNADAKGIGLFITKNQMEAMNGKIDVDSTIDIGSTFKLTFKKFKH